MPAPLRRCAALALLLLLVAGSALAAEPRPFDARYRLEVAGWPSTTVEHRLSRDGTHWQSDVVAGLVIGLAWLTGLVAAVAFAERKTGLPTPDRQR